eukprot:scaffold8431_cov115-Isochrysis_galbana.AAC.3
MPLPRAPPRRSCPRIPPAGMEKRLRWCRQSVGAWRLAATAPPAPTPAPPNDETHPLRPCQARAPPQKPHMQQRRQSHRRPPQKPPGLAEPLVAAPSSGSTEEE